jgi:hypothetical protein
MCQETSEREGLAILDRERTELFLEPRLNPFDRLAALVLRLHRSRHG